MKDSQRSLLLIFGLIVIFLLAACATGPVSVAPSATPSTEPSTAASTETPVPTQTPSPADTAMPISTATQAPADTAAPISTVTQAPADTATPISTATQVPTATSAPEPAATEPQRPTTSSEVPRLSARDLKDRLDNGEAILVVDARTTTAFESRHITGAISVPLSEVESRLDEFPRDQEIVFYCT
jgi:cytoskeletal protein RodZ